MIETTCPSGKVSYASSGDASIAMRRVKGRLRREADPGLTPFRCGHCDQWHLGRKNLSSRDKISLRHARERASRFAGE